MAVIDNMPTNQSVMLLHLNLINKESILIPVATSIVVQVIQDHLIDCFYS